MQGELATWVVIGASIVLSLGVIALWKKAVRVSAWIVQLDKTFKIIGELPEWQKQADKRLEKNERNLEKVVHETATNGGGSLKDLVVGIRSHLENVAAQLNAHNADDELHSQVYENKKQIEEHATLHSLGFAALTTSKSPEDGDNGEH